MDKTNINYPMFRTCNLEPVDGIPHFMMRFRQRMAAFMGVGLLCLLWAWFGMAYLRQGSESAALAMAEETETAVPHFPTNNTLLALYVLAYDNPRDNTGLNLTPKYTATLQSLVAATLISPDVTAVILADLDQAQDTHILIVHSGVISHLTGLPDPDGHLDPTLYEYDTTDGRTLGGFFAWARQRYPATYSLISYIGHGAPLVPKSEPAIADLITPPGNPSHTSTDALPMPLQMDVNPNFTDHHVPGAATPRLLTPHDLALALSLADDIIGVPVDVLDLVQCFAASIEELYEISPYAQTIVAAPNYAFFYPPMIGHALADLSADLYMVPTEMAATIMSTYFDEIPANRHPHVLVALDSSKIPLIKQQWDELSHSLWHSFQQQPDVTATALYDAYIQAAETGSVYDTTFCGQLPDYTLSPPDALSDLGQFALAVSQEFGTISPTISLQAMAATTAVNQAVIATSRQNGLPWWDATPDNWNFNIVSGISLFTPFQPMLVNNDSFHTWQALWYTTTTVIAEDVLVNGQLVDVLNPHPYHFILSPAQLPTWADVVDAYWRQAAIHPRQNLATAVCLTDLQEVETADLSLTASDTPDPAQAGWPVTYQVTITNRSTLSMPTVVLTMTLPLGVRLVQVTPAGCVANGRIITCALGLLTGHQQQTATVRVITLDISGNIQLHSTAFAAHPETNRHNNTTIETTYVRPSTFIYIPIARN